MRLMRVRRLGVLTAAGLGRMPMIGVVQVGAAGSLVAHPVNAFCHASRTLPVYVHLKGLAVWL